MTTFSRHIFVRVPRTRLIGREAELAKDRALLLDEAVPLATSTGPGGVGKTRLELSIADDVEESASQETQPAALRGNTVAAPTVAGAPQDYLIKMSTMMRRRQTDGTHVDPYQMSLNPAAYLY